MIMSQSDSQLFDRVSQLFREKKRQKRQRRRNHNNNEGLHYNNHHDQMQLLCKNSRVGSNSAATAKAANSASSTALVPSALQVYDEALDVLEGAHHLSTHISTSHQNARQLIDILYSPHIQVNQSKSRPTIN